MTENFTPSELIYLYLDGEADSMQTTTMFASLATDIELQQEFNEALSMRRAFEYERSTTKPPMYLTQRVYQSAGILPKVIGAGALGSGLWLWLRRAAIPVSSMILGGVITFFGMNWLDFGSSSSSRTSVGVPSSATTAYDANTSVVAPPPPAISSESSAPPAARSVRMPRAFPVVRHSLPQAQVPSMDESAKQSTNAASVNEGQLAAFLSERPLVAPASAYFNAMANRKLNMVNVSPASFSRGSVTDLTVYAGGIVGLDAYGSPKSSGIAGAFRDLSIAALYNVDENWSTGFSYSSSTFNVSSRTSHGIVLENPQIPVYGIQGQYMGVDEFLFGAQGFARVGVGYASISNASSSSNLFTADINLGLSYPVSMLRINPGVRIQGLYYPSLPGTSPVVGKVSLVLGLSYNINL